MPSFIATVQSKTSSSMAVLTQKDVLAEIHNHQITHASTAPTIFMCFQMANTMQHNAPHCYPLREFSHASWHYVKCTCCGHGSITYIK
jgi:hypothetical protein